MQGGSISPTLANITLDGLEEEIAKNYFLTKKGKVSYHQRYNKNNINIVRYSDDFVITANNKEILMEIGEVIRKFLERRGLELSEEKTLITNIKEGFDFLGWNFRKYNEKLIIKPSKKSVNNVVKKIGQTIRENKTVKQEHLIFKLNQILRGWCNYHQCVCAKETFQKLNYVIFVMLWKWVKRRHPNKNAQWVKDRYWKKKDSRDWIFSDGTYTLCESTVEK